MRYGAWYFPCENVLELYVLSGFPRKEGLKQGLSASFPLATVVQGAWEKARDWANRGRASAKCVLDLGTSGETSPRAGWNGCGALYWRREGVTAIYWFSAQLIKVHSAGLYPPDSGIPTVWAQHQHLQEAGHSLHRSSHTIVAGLKRQLRLRESGIVH